LNKKGGGLLLSDDCCNYTVQLLRFDFPFFILIQAILISPHFTSPSLSF
jgi:hypothetical protein